MNIWEDGENLYDMTDFDETFDKLVKEQDLTDEDIYQLAKEQIEAKKAAD
jgi:hypothetical protein